VVLVKVGVYTWVCCSKVRKEANRFGHREPFFFGFSQRALFDVVVVEVEASKGFVSRKTLGELCLSGSVERSLGVSSAILGAVFIGFYLRGEDFSGA